MTNMKRMQSSVLCAAALALFGLAGPPALSGQGVTTATVVGQVVDSDGQGVSGAQVIVTNTSTGVERQTLTREGGRFLLTGLRPGGPYLVAVQLIGYAEARAEDVELGLGETRQVNLTLRIEAVELGELRVLGEARSNTGVQTTVEEQTIQRAPTINREIVDLARLTPQAFVANEDDDGAAISIAGQNNEYNSLYIDGVVNNDVFGLAAQGTNGGQTGASPISFDAIEQLQVAISPYDVTQGGFTGGAINAITRSGTNELKGSIYYQLRNESLAGESVWLEEPEPLPDFSTGRYGFRLGGPIVENKAFFFINGELFRSETPRPFDFMTYRGSVTIGQLETLQQALRDVGYDPGSFRDQASSLDDNKLLAKIDWNLSNDHRLTVRHSYSQSDNVDAFGTSSSAINFSNNAEVFPNTTNSTALELHSTFGEYTNKLLLGMTFVRDDRNFAGDPFPAVQIFDDNFSSIFLGSEAFSTGNILNQDIFSITNNFNIFAGDHTITVGTHNEFYNLENLFLRQNFGSYRYNSLDAFLNDLAAVNDPSIDVIGPNRYQRGYSLVDDVTGDASDAIGAFKAYQLGVYVQDEWRPTARLQVSGGIRLDVPQITTDPRKADDAEQTLAAVSEFHDLEGAQAGETPGAALYFAPRLGINYNVTEDGSTQVRGGLGVFTGRVPFVFPGAMYVNNGVTAGFVQSSRLGNGSPIPFRPDVNNQYDATDFGFDSPIPSGELDIFAEDFRYPRVFRTSAGVDQRLPFGFELTLEGQYTKTLDNINTFNVNLLPQNDRLDGPDNRPVYNYGVNRFGELEPGFIDPRYGAIMLVTNTDEGYTYDLTASLRKAFLDNALDTRLSYTFGDAYALNDVTSDQVFSLWRFNSNVNGLNALDLARSDFSIGHRLLGTASYRQEFLSHLATTISLVYTGESGRPFSYVIGGFTTGLVGEPDGSEPLLYVPTENELGQMQFEDAAQAQAFNNYIEANDYLSGRRGQYAERNADRAPFEHGIDLHLAQELFGNMFGRRNTVEVTLDVFNFTNLLNEDWGRRYDVGFRAVPVLRFEGFVDAEAGDLTPVYSFDTEQPTIDDFWENEVLDFGTYGSRWLMQFGLRYTF